MALQAALQRPGLVRTPRPVSRAASTGMSAAVSHQRSRHERSAGRAGTGTAPPSSWITRRMKPSSRTGGTSIPALPWPAIS